MKYLLIDTTKAEAYVLVNVDGAKTLSVLDKNVKHNENLLFAVEDALRRAKVKLSDMDAFGVISGPGSFTGIRVGMSSIKAFCIAHRKPSFSITNFDIIRTCMEGDGVILIPCTHTSMYYWDKDECGVISDVAAKEKFKDENVYVLDNDERFGGLNITVIDYAKALVNNIDSIKYNLVDSNLLVPYYLELSQAEREANAKHEGS